MGRRVSGKNVLLLRHTGAVDAGRTHLCEDLVQPLQRAIEVQLYPAGGAGHRLTSGGYREGEGQLSLSLLIAFHTKLVTSLKSMQRYSLVSISCLVE